MSVLKPLALAVLSLSLLSLTGCDRGLKADIHKPSTLPEITAPAQSLTEIWHEKIGGAKRHDPLRLQLAVADGVIIATNRQGDVTAWDDNGQKRWTRKLKRDISGGVSLQGDLAVVGSNDGHLIALSAKTGEIRWQRALSSSLLAPALVTADRVVVIANDGTVTGTDRVTGQPVWSFDVAVPALSMRGVSAPVLFDDTLVVVSSAGGRLYALDLKTGVPQWERRVAFNDGRSEVQRLIDIDGDPLISGRQLYAVSYQGQLVALDLDSQRTRWRAETSSLRGTATGLGNIYVVNTTGHLQAYDEQDGKLLWTQKSLAWRDVSNPVVLGRYVVVGDAQGYLHLIEQTEGKVVGRVRTRGAVRFLRVVGDRLLVDSSTGALSIWQVR
jgi:outer membrane protein assembly factor BamB